jgi:ribA/ribD-fused uncharacterized protein
MKYQLFYETKEDYGFCSNFFQLKTPLIIDGEKWSDTEQYFQAMKFRGPNADTRSLTYSNLIKEADSPMKIKLLGSQKKNLHYGKNWVLNKKTDKRLINDLVDEYMDVKIRKDWENVKVNVMIKALVYKFRIPSLRAKLVALPADTLLVEHTTRDTIWADGGDGGTGEKGKNFLGKLLTILAYVLKDKSCKKMSKELRKAVKCNTSPKGAHLQTVYECGNQCSLLQGKFEITPEDRRSIEGIELQTHKVFVYGKYHDTPREVGFYSDADIKGYGYSGNILKTQKLIPALKNILVKVNKITGSDFNAILMNRYRCGDDYIGAHSDDEKALGKSGVVTISFGQQRTFRLRNKKTKEIVKEIQVKDGDLYWMKGCEFQGKLTHEIPKEKGCKGVRLSLTFRKHLY